MCKYSTLLEACKTGKIEEVKSFLQDKEDGSFEDFRDSIKYIINKGFNDIVELLASCEVYLDNHVKVRELNKDDDKEIFGMTKDGIVIEIDDSEFYLPFFKNISVEDGCTTLMYTCREYNLGHKTSATKNNYLEIVKILISQQKGMKDIFGRTALMYAAREGNTEIVELLLPYEKCERDVYGWSALMFAAINGRLENVKLLVEHEKDILSEHYHTALMWAVYYDQTECVKYLIPYLAGKQHIDTGWSALMWAARYDKPECVKLLVEHEKDLRDEYDETALMKAATGGNTKCVKILIPHEAGIQNDNDWTALMKAACQKNIEIVKLLIPHEAGIEPESYYDQSFLFINKKSLGTALINAITFRGFYECAPCHYGPVEPPSEEVITEYVKLLAPHECHLYESKEVSALVQAEEKGYSECVKILTFYEYFLSKNWFIQDFDEIESMIHEIYDDTSDFYEYIKSISESYIIFNNCTPFIPTGSFLDILNKAAKQQGKNYDDSMSEIIDKMEKLSLSVLLEYSKIIDLDVMETRIINEFSEYKEKIPQIIQELKTEKLECIVCLEDSAQLYRNCVNCTVNLCKDCWANLDKCPQCRSDIKWKKGLSLFMLHFMDKQGLISENSKIKDIPEKIIESHPVILTIQVTREKKKDESVPSILTVERITN